MFVLIYEDMVENMTSAQKARAYQIGLDGTSLALDSRVYRPWLRTEDSPVAVNTFNYYPAFATQGVVCDETVHYRKVATRMLYPKYEVNFGHQALVTGLQEAFLSDVDATLGVTDRHIDLARTMGQPRRLPVERTQVERRKVLTAGAPLVAAIFLAPEETTHTLVEPEALEQLIVVHEAFPAHAGLAALLKAERFYALP